MGDVLDEVTDETIDAGHVLRRVEDWEARVDGLYAAIRAWLPEGWTAREGTPARMYEELMREFGVPARTIPTLLLDNGAGRSAMLEPRALWIVGANGRVDMTVGGRHYLLVDVADNFETPHWQAASLERRLDRVALTESWFARALS